MSTLTRLSLRNAWSDRATSMLTASAVVMAVGFMSGVLMLSGGLGGRAAGGLSVAYRHIPLVVHGPAVSSNPPGEYITGSGAPVPAAALDAVRATPGVHAAVGLRSEFASVELPDGEVVGSPGTGGGIGANWVTDTRLNPYHLVAGAPPVAPDQVVVDQAAARRSHVSVGRAALLVSAAGRQHVTIVGIARLGDAAGPFESTAVLLDPLSAHQQLGGGPDSFDQLLVSADPTATAMIARDIRPWRASVTTGAAWAATAEASITTTLSFERVFLLGFAAVALVAGGTLISNTITATTARRAREQALARALGATRRQVLRTVLGEAAAVGLAASVVGAGLGVAMAELVRAVFGWLGLALFDTQATVTALSLGLPVVIGIAVTVVAAVGPARRASAVTPVAALRVQQVDDSASSLRRAGLGAATLAAGCAATLAAVVSQSQLLSGVGMAGLLIGSIVAGPVLVGRLGSALATPLRRLAGPSGLLAGRGLARNPRRSAATASALMIGVMLVTFVTTIVASVNQGTATSASKGIKANFVVATASNWRPQVTPSVMRRVGEDRKVKATSPVFAAFARWGSTLVRVGTVDPGSINELWDFHWGEGSLASVEGDQVAVEDTSLAGARIGDRRLLTLADGTVHLVRISAVFTSGFIGFNAPTYILSPALYHAHAAEQGAQLLLVGTVAGTTAGDLRASLGGDGTVSVESAHAWLAQGNTKVRQVADLFYALDALAILIAFAGVTNTVGLTVRERRRELGVLRATGFLPRQIGRMTALESVILSTFATALGCALGIVGCFDLTRSSRSADLSQFRLPIVPLAAVAGGAVLIGVLLAAVPARSAARTPVLEAVAYE